MAYPFKDVESKWQRYWQEKATFKTPDRIDPQKPKYYVLDMFPYPSGEGLHVGHPVGYTATDIIARYKRMNGFNVLHPMGWDAFGLPAERFAAETGIHPAVTTRRNTDRFRRQMQRLGFSYDWGREVGTTDPGYYRWTQWIFLQLYKKGLAYLDWVPVNWCPALKTVLADEEVKDGRSEIGGHEVLRRPLRQWMLKITHYADRLLEDLDELDWPEGTKKMQREWIGHSEGMEIDFAVKGSSAPITVFTTRPETIFGATYLVLSPEHPRAVDLTTPERRTRVANYRRRAGDKKAGGRRRADRAVDGVFTGSCAINPADGNPVPVWIADYVLDTYGSGAIMAVPAHDARDYAFARRYDLPVKEVVSGGNIKHAAHEGDGRMIHSSAGGLKLDGRTAADARQVCRLWLVARGVGRERVQYKIKDWLFSRQRYWGEPFPVLHGPDGEIRLLEEDQLPLRLPEMDDFDVVEANPGRDQEPEAALRRAPESWRQVVMDGKTYTRELNTMPQWAGSCWYFLRFIDPQNREHPVDRQKEKYWMPVDLYVGGTEHAVLHLLYARFWHKVLYDIGAVSTREPFARLVHQGMILGEPELILYRDANGNAVSCEHVDKHGNLYATGEQCPYENLKSEQVVKKGDRFYWIEDERVQVACRAFKMSKSRGNVVNPDEMVDTYGADTLRLFLMFLGPLEDVKPWDAQGIEGPHRFLSRVWRWVVDETTGSVRTDMVYDPPSDDQQAALHGLIRKVTADMEKMAFNTAIAAMMKFVRKASKWEKPSAAAIKTFLVLLNPFAPHITEELWCKLVPAGTIAQQRWPSFDEAYIRTESVEIVVQFNGKKVTSIQVDAAAADDRKALEEAVLRDRDVQRRIGGRMIRQVVAVPGRLVNILLC